VRPEIPARTGRQTRKEQEARYRSRASQSPTLCHRVETARADRGLGGDDTRMRHGSVPGQDAPVGSLTVSAALSCAATHHRLMKTVLDPPCDRHQAVQPRASRPKSQGGHEHNESRRASIVADQARGKSMSKQRRSPSAVRAGQERSGVSWRELFQCRKDEMEP